MPTLTTEQHRAIDRLPVQAHVVRYAAGQGPVVALPDGRTRLVNREGVLINAGRSRLSATL